MPLVSSVDSISLADRTCTQSPTNIPFAPINSSLGSATSIPSKGLSINILVIGQVQIGNEINGTDKSLRLGRQKRLWAPISIPVEMSKYRYRTDELKRSLRGLPPTTMGITGPLHRSCSYR